MSCDVCVCVCAREGERGVSERGERAAIECAHARARTVRPTGRKRKRARALRQPGAPQHRIPSGCRAAACPRTGPPERPSRPRPSRRPARPARPPPRRGGPGCGRRSGGGWWTCCAEGGCVVQGAGRVGPLSLARGVARMKGNEGGRGRVWPGRVWPPTSPLFLPFSLQGSSRQGYTRHTQRA